MESNRIESIVGSKLKSLSKALKEEILDKSNYTSISDEYQIDRFIHKGRAVGWFAWSYHQCERFGQ